MSREGRRIEIRGEVQGVGFRPWVYRVARRNGVYGEVRNDAAGVTIDAYGAGDTLDRFCRQLRATLPPPTARIRDLRWRALSPGPGAGGADFRIAASAGGEERRLALPPDLATCEACQEELLDPVDRRFRYPFTNCTHCGPRFTIALDVPYDRAKTTMAGFALCAECAREYVSPLDRRFHAQPNACPVCGPRLRVLHRDGRVEAAADPVAAVAAALGRGEIVAVKGIGGFHLACDATAAFVVERLRQRKRRRAKPFAVMVADVEAARRLATLSDLEERLLAGAERPVVLVRRRTGSELAPAVAPDLSLVGLLLPYSPLHHLLLAAVGRPLVMTSANRAGEPIARRDDEAIERMRGVADRFLVHDREIANRCDDSVARIVAGGPVLLRRSRGFVPRPVDLRREVRRPTLACGAHLKNTICIAVGDSAYLGPHVGDLETVESYDALGESVERLQRYLGIEPETVAHDLHPGYLSTRFAREYARDRGARRCAVQHHHAHLVSALAEHGLEGEALGVIYDGTGYGTDGTAWGGEVLFGSAAGYRRVATVRPLPLAGGEQAIRQVWRLALAALDDAFGGSPPLPYVPLFATVDGGRVELVRQLLSRSPRSSMVPRARGVGRYFDALAAIVLGRGEARYEGDLALQFGELAKPNAAPYPFSIDRGATPWEIDLRPMVRAVVADLVAGASAIRISSRFHATLLAATAAVVRAFAADHGRVPVMASGGCFANPLLAAGLVSRLQPELAVYLQRAVPPGDGGIALGQALVADAADATLGAAAKSYGGTSCV